MKKITWQITTGLLAVSLVGTALAGPKDGTRIKSKSMSNSKVTRSSTTIRSVDDGRRTTTRTTRMTNPAQTKWRSSTKTNYRYPSTTRTTTTTAAQRHAQQVAANNRLLQQRRAADNNRLLAQRRANDNRTLAQRRADANRIAAQRRANANRILSQQRANANR